MGVHGDEPPGGATRRRPDGSDPPAAPALPLIPTVRFSKVASLSREAGCSWFPEWRWLMARSARVLVSIVLALAAGCAEKVVREGPGWRETEGKEPGKTAVEVTTSDPKALAEL